jgi:transposase-like protein
MEDIFDATVLCDQCNQKTEKKIVIEDGFQMRSWGCLRCQKTWQHPGDVQEYQNFKQLKNKTFQVKLRYVGNSYTVSIPREIIDFEEDALKEFAKMDKILKMMLEEPGKISIFFSSNMKRFMNEEEDG